MFLARDMDEPFHNCIQAVRFYGWFGSNTVDLLMKNDHHPDLPLQNPCGSYV
jgi:hypothetical protein